MNSKLQSNGHPRARRLIESDAFPFEFISQLAEMESWRKEVYRPIYHIHKWWAKRLGSVFRGILLGSVLPDSENLVEAFYRQHDFGRLTVFDPFMGSGTTIGEAHKLGFPRSSELQSLTRRWEMSTAAPTQDSEQALVELRAKVLREVSPAFRASVSPRIVDEDVQAGVALLFQLLAHSVGDWELDAVGEEIATGLRRWFHDGELVKLADRYEPFCKFMLKVIDPAKFALLQAETGNRLSASKVLKALGLVNNKALSAFESCAWEQFPPPHVVGQADFLEHVARTYVFRNVDDHQARVLNQRERAQIAESFCLFLVWCIIKFSPEIRGALTTATFSSYLGEVRTRFAAIGSRFVELTTEARSPEEYRLLDPLSTSPDGVSFSESTDASKLPEANRVTVIEAEPGAGKTTTLQFLAWQRADGILARKEGYCSCCVFNIRRGPWSEGESGTCDGVLPNSG